MTRLPYDVERDASPSQFGIGSFFGLTFPSSKTGQVLELVAALTFTVLVMGVCFLLSR